MTVTFFSAFLYPAYVVPGEGDTVGISVFGPAQVCSNPRCSWQKPRTNLCSSWSHSAVCKVSPTLSLFLAIVVPCGIFLKMASLNLSSNGPSIVKSYQAVVNSSPPTNSSSPTYGQWAVFSVSAPLVSAFQQDTGSKESVLKVQSTGGQSNAQ